MITIRIPEQEINVRIQALLFAAFIIGLSGDAARAAGSNLRPVADLDLSCYTGVWYEIARLPNTFQKSCTGDVTATYTVLEDGTIEVLNSCRGGDGKMMEIKGVAKLADEDGPNSRLKVRFAPAFLSYLDAVWADYWIIDLAPDYSYAVIGEPERKYLWILARKPWLDRETLTGIAERAAKNGFNVGKLVKTDHSFE
jgi:apolipoprotein D and lipocalin family protein